MNVKSILIWAMAIGTLSSCMSNEDMYDPEKAEALKVAKYEAAFVKKYGKVDPKQDWGFGEAEAAMQAVTRGRLTNGNEWEKTYILPESVTDVEIGKVVAAFEEPVYASSVELEFTDFFLLQVFRNNENYTTKSGKSGVIYEKMDNFKYNDGEVLANQGEIIDCGVRRNDNPTGEKIVLLTDETSNGKFKFQATLGTECWYDDHYLIKEIDGNYYVGFDFESSKGSDDQIVERDYVFKDAIFKIVPALRKDTRRIMAEDLATNEGGDFDFNDVVFDARVLKRDWPERAYAEITLRAAGGTLPLYIGQKKPEYEVHKLFGVEQTTMVNTQKGKETEISPVKFEVELVDLPRETWGGISNGHPTLDDIPIYVGDSDIPLKAEVGGVPAKLCCPANYKWSNERESIEDSFSGFTEAVSSGKQWYVDGNPGWQ